MITVIEKAWPSSLICMWSGSTIRFSIESEVEYESFQACQNVVAFKKRMVLKYIPPKTAAMSRTVMSNGREHMSDGVTGTIITLDHAESTFFSMIL